MVVIVYSDQISTVITNKTSVALSFRYSKATNNCKRTASKTTYNCKRTASKQDTTANDQSMMEQLGKVRANRKYVLTIAYKVTKRTALELNRDAVLAHRQLLMTAFKLFEEASNEYLAVLEREEDVQCAEDYYDIEEKVYIENLKI